MAAPPEVDAVAHRLLAPQDLRPVSIRVLQSLWAGYGHICHISAVSLPTSGKQKQQQQQREPVSLILKHVRAPSGGAKAGDEGQLRKIISYQVEQYFYTHLATRMPRDIAVASCLWSINTNQSSTTSDSRSGDDGGGTVAMIVTDLRSDFPVAGEKRAALDEVQVHAALRWLAFFHGFWWARARELGREALRRPPLEEAERQQRSTTPARQGEGRTGGVWLNGGYTYLATRRTEYQSLVDDSGSEWSAALCTPLAHSGQSIAELAAQLLAPAPGQPPPSSRIGSYETLIHGDVKSENLFASADGRRVAFYDFQYVGLGLGVCDLAKFFTCSVPLGMLTADESLAAGNDVKAAMGAGERVLLEEYRGVLEAASGRRYEWEVLVRHWETALVDWLRFQASWGFWGNTGWLEARVRSILNDNGWRAWLHEEGH